MTTATATLVRTEGRKKFLHYVFTTAIEGGIGYWAQVESYRWMNENRRPESTIMDDDYLDLDGFRAVITSSEGNWGVSTAYQSHVTLKGVTEVDPYLVAPDGPLHIDIHVIERGVDIMIGKVLDIVKNPATVKNWRVYREMVQFVVQWLTDGEDGDSDASMCEQVLQLGLFGKTVYA